MIKEAICVSICAETADEMKRRALEAAEVADLIELRLDCLNADELPNILASLSFPKPILITRRPVEQGGHWIATREKRIEFWKDMPRHITPDGIKCFFDIELDISSALHVHGDGFVISHHDFGGVPDAIDILFEEMNGGDSISKIAWKTDDITDTIPFVHLVEAARETNRWVAPIPMGECGKWTRILGPALGAKLTYSSFEAGGETAPGQVTAKDLRDVYRTNELDDDVDICGIIGGNTSYSMSPFMHNAAFMENRMNAVFVPLQMSDIGAFIERMVSPETREVAINFKGFSVTIPFKSEIIEFLDIIDPAAAAIGAVNTVKIENGKLVGYNTDAQGFIEPLAKKIANLRDMKVAVLGAGGAARACIQSLTSAGCRTTVFARDIAKAGALTEDFGVALRRLDKDSYGDFDIVVNTTPLGTKGAHQNESIADASQLSGVKLAYDLVYNPQDTKFLAEAKTAGCETLGGFEMLLAQAALQQKIWTGLDAPIDAMRKAALGRLG